MARATSTKGGSSTGSRGVKRSASEGRGQLERTPSGLAWKVLVLSGPNLHRLGKRQPEIYGRQTLAQIHELLAAEARSLGGAVECRQSNYEGELVEWIGDAAEQGFAGIVINPGAYTHTSYALYDALLAAGVPAVEVHLSNPEAREPFRRHSCTAPACIGKVAGFGDGSYLLGLRGLAARLARSPA